MINLSSDTVTKPSPEMRRAMAEAEVGDDVFLEDPTVRSLEEKTAEILGKEEALYTPSGCMANQLALKVHTIEGDEVIVEADSHIFNDETTAASFLSRIQLNPIAASDRGLLTAAEIAPAIRDKAYYMPVTRLIVLENTHNAGGGTVYPIDRIAGIRDLAKENGIAMHLDGARLWNACASSGLAPREYAEYFDTAAVCFSKSLGGPVGSALAGPHELIERARRYRKIWGGGMRQAGIIAAGALYALTHNQARLSEDHAKALRFAQIISENASHVSVDMTRVETSFVLLKLEASQKVPDLNLDKALSMLEKKGVRLSAGAHGLLRAVMHLDVTIEECERAAYTVVELFG